MPKEKQDKNTADEEQSPRELGSGGKANYLFDDEGAPDFVSNEEKKEQSEEEKVQISQSEGSSVKRFLNDIHLQAG